MSEEANRPAEHTGDSQEVKFGCGAWLGVLVLLAAVGAVLYFLILKPVMEKNQEQLSDKWNSVKEHAANTLEKGSEAVSKTRKAVKSLRNSAEESAGEVREKTEDTAEDIREKSETVQETASEVKDKVKKQVEKEPESWY